MPFLNSGEFKKISSKPVIPPREVKKEEKKDTSAFQGNSSLSREGVRNWLRREEAWKITKKSTGERAGMEKQLFLEKEVGKFVDPKEADKVFKELKDYPTRAKEKYGIKSEGERYKTLELLKKFLGK